MRVGQPNPRNWRNVPRKPRYIWLLATRQLARKRQRSLMSLLITSPATVAAAATHLAGIGSALSTANAAAAAPTTALSVAGADEVSVLIAALFEAYAQEYQALSAQALAFHDQFVQALNMGAVCYAAAETANATPLQALQTVQQNVLTVVNAPTQALLGRPIIGNGANGLPNTGQDGGPGGLLFGNGGTEHRPLDGHPPGRRCRRAWWLRRGERACLRLRRRRRCRWLGRADRWHRPGGGRLRRSGRQRRAERLVVWQRGSRRGRRCRRSRHRRHRELRRPRRGRR